MGEGFKGERGHEAESSRLYDELGAALGEQERVGGEIDEALAGATDRAAAEREVLAQLAPQMDDAVRRTGEAWSAWKESVEQAQEEFEQGAEE